MVSCGRIELFKSYGLKSVFALQCESHRFPPYDLNNQTAFGKAVYSIFGAKVNNRKLTYKKRWKELIEYYGARCKNSKTKEWGKWLLQLRAAGIPVEAHRKTRDKMAKLSRKTRDEKLEVLIDEYSYVLESDDEFAGMLMVV